MPKEELSRMERENIPDVSTKSSPELIEQRVKELYPLMMEIAKLKGVDGNLDYLIKYKDSGLDEFKQFPADAVPDVPELLQLSQFLKIAGMSDREVMLTPFWKEGMEEARAKLAKKLEELNQKYEALMSHTDYSIGQSLVNTVNLRVSLDSLRKVVDSDETYNMIVEDLVKRHRKEEVA